jgi:hypothetical protein
MWKERLRRIKQMGHEEYRKLTAEDKEKELRDVESAVSRMDAREKKTLRKNLTASHKLLKSKDIRNF